MLTTLLLPTPPKRSRRNLTRAWHLRKHNYGEDRAPELIKGVPGHLEGGFIPFSKQRKVRPNQQLFALGVPHGMGSQGSASLNGRESEQVSDLEPDPKPET